MSHESFWEFSLRVYRLPQVSDACLLLQNAHGFDVNLLLFACWYGRTHGTMPPSLLADVQLFSTQWATEVVRPLRRARTWMKGALADSNHPLAGQSDATQLREKIKAVELRSEQLQQHALEQLANTSLQGAVAAPLQPVQAANAIAGNLAQLREASAVTLSPALAGLLLILQEKSLSA